MLKIPDQEPDIATIVQANREATTVRNAVATVESIPRRPHFATMEVKPAQTAEQTASNIHIGPPS